jgi:hypothetical protein
MISIKRIAKSLTPPPLWQAMRKLKPRSEIALRVEGPFPSWEAAASIADGWDAPSIIDKTAGKVPALLKSLAFP